MAPICFRCESSSWIARFGTIKTQIKKLGFTLAAIIVVGLVFNLGQRCRLASLQQPQRQQASLLSRARLRGSAYLVTANPDNAAMQQGGGFLPSAVAAEPSSTPAASDDSSGAQSDDLLNSDSPAATFQQVYLLLKDQFVDRIDSDEPLAHGASSALLASLDEPNSRFIEKAERDSLEQQADGIYQGIGAAITVRRVTRPDGIIDRQITVIDPLPGSPAEKAGLKTGDVITDIDGHWIIGFDPFAAQASVFKKLAKDEFDLGKAVDAVEKQITDGDSLAKAQTILDTKSDTPLKLTIQRSGVAKPFDVTIDGASTTQVADVESHKMADGNGYIGINIFSTDTASKFSTAVQSMSDAKGLIIDLRDCSGGLLDPAVAIAKSLAPSAPFGQIQLRDNTPTASGKKPLALVTKTQDITSAGADTVTPSSFHGPISVLVNKGTANSAELLAAFLHDQVGARIIGSSTFGDGSAQTLFPLTDGSAFTLTTGVLKTDHGQVFNMSGLAPDYVMADAGHAGDETGPALLKADSLLAIGPNSNTETLLHPLKAASATAGNKGGMSL